jgi:pimeloyl-ACP methyl ester carboxylesterase
MITLQTRAVAGKDGALAVHERSGTNGRRAGTPVLLLHGIQGSAGAWRQVMQATDRELRLVAPDLRGRGGSVTPDQASAYRLEAFAADLDAVVADLGVPVILAGWSMGVLVTLTYLRDYGCGAVAGLVLIGGTCCPRPECRWFEGDTVEAIASEASARARLLGLTETAAPVAVAGSWLSAREADFREFLPRIHLPTVVLHGGRDDQCPVTHAEFMARAIPGARLDILPEAGHGLPAEAPGFLAERITAAHRRWRF